MPPSAAVHFRVATIAVYLLFVYENDKRARLYVRHISALCFTRGGFGNQGDWMHSKLFFILDVENIIFFLN